jgi:hypothetical protein
MTYLSLANSTDFKAVIRNLTTSYCASRHNNEQTSLQSMLDKRCFINYSERPIL